MSEEQRKPMKLDVSEVKEFRHCRRKWQLSSRNQFHMTAIVQPKAFKLGTVFHECLHKLYLGKDIDAVVEYLQDQLVGSEQSDITMLTAMITGYNREVIPLDMQRYRVLDIEHHFSFSPFDLLDDEGRELLCDIATGSQISALLDVEIAGSIDMIVLDTETNLVYGFEHKTAKNFRNDVYLWMDEQPRLYYAAMQQWVEHYNERKWGEWMDDCHAIDSCRGEGTGTAIYGPPPVTVALGGVFINEVKKLMRAFSYKRSLLTYDADDLRNFLLAFMTSCAECHKYVDNPQMPRLPMPDMMGCMNCMFNTVCQTVQYKDLNPEYLLHEFKHEFKVREEDHLNEKEEVTAE